MCVEIEGIKFSSKKCRTISLKTKYLINNEQEKGFTALAGTPLNHPAVPVKNGTAKLIEVDSRGSKADTWHTDISIIEDYPKSFHLTQQ